MARPVQPLLTEAQILDALRDCYDPALKVNLVDLGLIYLIATGHDPASTPAWPRQWVKVTMTLPTQESAASGLIVEQVNNRLAGMQQISKVEVDLVWEPKWTWQHITPAGLRQLADQEAARAQSATKKTVNQLVNISLKTGNRSEKNK